MDLVFSDLQKKWNKKQEELEKEKQSKEIENSENESAAEMLFHEAVYDWRIDESIQKALDAYELSPENYQYKIFAISRYTDKEKRLKDIRDLVDLVNKEIETSKTSLYHFYDSSEIDSERYIDLRYLLITSLVENGEYKASIEEIKKFTQKYGFYERKVKNLLLNSCLILGLYEEVVAFYDEEIDEDITIMIPVSDAYLKLKKYKNFRIMIDRIEALNENFEPCISCIDLEETIQSIKKSNNKYNVGSLNEMYYAFKYFEEFYINDKEYLSSINMYNKSVL